MAPFMKFQPSSSFLPSLLIICICWLSACSPESQQQDSEEELEEYLPDSTNTEGMAFTEACFKYEHTICEMGLEFVRIGDSIHHISLDQIPEGGWKDTILNGSGYNWKSITLAMADGNITIEGEFIDDRYPIDYVYRAPVSRIRIENPEYKTLTSLRVGSTISELTSIFPDSLIQLTPFPNYDAIQINTLNGSHLNYLVLDPEKQIAIKSGGVPTIEDLPSSTEIFAIVVM